MAEHALASPIAQALVAEPEFAPIHKNRRVERADAGQAHQRRESQLHPVQPCLRIGSWSRHRAHTSTRPRARACALARALARAHVCALGCARAAGWVRCRRVLERVRVRGAMVMCGGKGYSKGEMDNDALELHDSVMHACGGRREMAREVLVLLDEALESGVLAAARGRCAEFLMPAEDLDGGREGRDRGTHRFLKAVTVLMRLKGFNSRDRMMPIREIELTGQPLMAFVAPSRGAGAPNAKLEPVIRCLELAVHLARSSNFVTAIRLGECELSSEGGDKCATELVRLVRQVGIGAQARFLEEVDLRSNALDAEAVKKIVEAAVKERCERPRACEGAPPLWLDLSFNRVRNAQTVFQNLQAWASWAHDKGTALCLADQEGCSKQACPKGCLLHMPRFLEQSKGEAKELTSIGSGGSESKASAAASSAPSASRVAAPPPKPMAWRDVEDMPRSQALVRERARERDNGTSRRVAGAAGSSKRRSASRSRRRRRSRRRQSRSASRGRAAAAPVKVVLKPGPGTRVKVERSRSRSRRRGRSVSGGDRRGRRSVREEEEELVSEEGSDEGSDAAPDGDSYDEGEEEEEEEVAGSGSQSGGSSSSDASPSPAARPSSAAAVGAAAARPSAEDLERRMSRLIESLKSSASVAPASAGHGTAKHDAGGKTKSRTEAEKEPKARSRDRRRREDRRSRDRRRGHNEKDHRRR
mmetsp:Transcript_73728/g.238694  ORF Transcript_73728/g.238694 Transcript_73728/m.238694 type:complete len:702 (-) Transcript_73728:65-2170(-)